MLAAAAAEEGQLEAAHLAAGVARETVDRGRQRERGPVLRRTPALAAGVGLLAAEDQITPEAAAALALSLSGILTHILLQVLRQDRLL